MYNLVPFIRTHPALKADDESNYTQTDRARSHYDGKWSDNSIPGLFRASNTDVENLKRRCQELNSRDSQYNCVLIITGSMNPVHRSHVGNLELVREHLERSQTRWNVLAGYLSPTHDAYVRGKLGKATMSGNLRCELCELAIEEHEHVTRAPHWLRVSRAESEFRNGFVDFGPVSKALGSYLNSTLVGPDKFLKYPLHTIYVCGLDHFNKCADVERLAKTDYIKCAVIYRKGSEERHVRSLNDFSNIIYVGLQDERQTLVDISSTAIRHRLADSANNLDEFTYESVARRLKAKH